MTRSLQSAVEVCLRRSRAAASASRPLRRERPSNLRRCLFIFGIAGLLCVPETHYPARAGDKPSLASSKRSVESSKSRQRPDNFPADKRLPSLTGEAAKLDLRSKGQYESLAAAFHAAQYAVEKIDPATLCFHGAEFFAANPKQKLRAFF